MTSGNVLYSLSPKNRKNGFCSCHLQVEPGIHNFQYFRSSGGYVDFFKKCGVPIEDRINSFYGDCIILIIHLHTINMIALSLQKKKRKLPTQVICAFFHVIWLPLLLHVSTKKTCYHLMFLN